MSSVVRFLEAISCNPAVFVMPDAYAQAVADLDVGDDVRSALLARDALDLAGLLGGRPSMFCMIMTPDDQEKEDAPDQGEEEKPEKVPDKDLE